jgi:hypothetical protein
MTKQYHYAEVTRIVDPDLGAKLRGAVYFRSETLTGDVEYPIPAEPRFPFAKNKAGFFWVPEPGDIIEIEIDSDLETPEPKWLGMVYSTEDELPREFIKNYTKRMGFVTKSGNMLVFDDTSGSEELWLEHFAGSQLKFFQNGNISLKARKVTKRDKENEASDSLDSAFSEVLLDFQNKVAKFHDHFTNKIQMDTNGILIQDKNGNKITQTAAGLKIEDATGNTVELAAAGIKVTSSGTVEIDGTTILMQGGGGLAARAGDVAEGIGNLGGPVISTIITGSSTVLIGG